MAKKYINKLEDRVDELEERIGDVEEWLQSFRNHLDLPKFKGSDERGERKDWIAVGDVQKWLDELYSLLD